MTTRRAKSISVKDLSAKTSEIAKRAVEKQAPSLRDARLEQGFFPDLGIFGYILRDFDLGAMKPVEVVGLSSAIAEGVGDHALFGEQVTVLQKGGLIFGYWPIEEIVQTQMGL